MGIVPNTQLSTLTVDVLLPLPSGKSPPSSLYICCGTNFSSPGLSDYLLLLALDTELLELS